MSPTQQARYEKRLRFEARHFQQEFEEMIEREVGHGPALDEDAKRRFLNRADVREIRETFEARIASIRQLTGEFTVNLGPRQPVVEEPMPSRSKICDKIFPAGQIPTCRYCFTTTTSRPRVEGGVL